MTREDELRTLWDGIVDLAHDQMRELKRLPADLTPNRKVAAARTLGIAVQQLLSMAQHLSDTDLPEDIADLSDDEQRELVKRLLWRHARAGKANSARDLATKLGIKDARSQGLEVVLGESVRELLGDRVPPEVGGKTPEDATHPPPRR